MLFNLETLADMFPAFSPRNSYLQRVKKGAVPLGFFFGRPSMSLLRPEAEKHLNRSPHPNGFFVSPSSYICAAHVRDSNTTPGPLQRKANYLATPPPDPSLSCLAASCLRLRVVVFTGFRINLIDPPLQSKRGTGLLGGPQARDSSRHREAR
jgi:hypothetical protein